VAALYPTRYKRTRTSWTPDDDRKEAPMAKRMHTLCNERAIGVSRSFGAAVTPAR